MAASYPRQTLDPGKVSTVDTGYTTVVTAVDQGWLAEGGFSVTNLGNLNRIRHDQGCLAKGGFSVTNLGNLRRRGLEGEPRNSSNF